MVCTGRQTNRGFPLDSTIPCFVSSWFWFLYCHSSSHLLQDRTGLVHHIWEVPPKCLLNQSRVGDQKKRKCKNRERVKGREEICGGNFKWIPLSSTSREKSLFLSYPISVITGDNLGKLGVFYEVIRHNKGHLNVTGSHLIYIDLIASNKAPQ